MCVLARMPTSDKLDVVETRYVLPTDNNPITSICGLPDGRIFLGGAEGSLFEFAYESFVQPLIQTTKTPAQLLDDFYDGDATTVNIQPPTMATTILNTGKRSLENFYHGTASEAHRPRKCRKLNHSSHPFTKAASVVLADWMVRIPSQALSRIFFPSSSSIGAIRQVLHDPERSTLYALTDGGTVSVYALCAKDNSLQHRSKLDLKKAAQKYLTLMAKGHMNAPSSSGVDFWGGGFSAQRGVGGMDGARAILKANDKANGALLKPISIHVVPRRESSQLTLVAVSGGGMRCYLTTLPSGHNTKLTPSSRLTLCHMRAPPPVDPSTGSIILSGNNYVGIDDEDDIPGGTNPRLIPQTAVDSASYSDGNLFLALQPPKASRTNDNGGEVGNLIVVANPDVTGRRVIKNNTGHTEMELLRTNGISETISLPAEQVLPGGRIVDSCIHSQKPSAILNLVMNSKTPTDGELSIGLVPAYDPKSKEKKKHKKQQNHFPSNGSSSRALVTTTPNPSVVSVSLRLLSNFMLSRPLSYGFQLQNGSLKPIEQEYQPLYRISNRYGASNGGFSKTAGSGRDQRRPVSSRAASTRRSSNRSVRLSNWLLHPPPAPLSPLAITHLMPSTETVALSVGGLHYFKTSTVLEQLTETLMSAQADVSRDAQVDKFFKQYGYKQACALCLSLIAGCNGSTIVSEELQNRSKRAALSRAFVPYLVKKSEEQRVTVVEDSSNQDRAVPEGFQFVPSKLFEGLTATLSRLLRPIWFKPAVVVTEGQTIASFGLGGKKQLPAKVELLLDDETTLEEIRRPLVALQKFMLEIFAPAINVIPGVQQQSMGNAMDLDEGYGNHITGSLLFQGARRNLSAPGSMTAALAEEISRKIEERNIHALYRLVSRTIQLLSLVSLLKKIQFQPDLPEVAFGLLHGLHFCQLVEDKGAHERIETLLNALVSNRSSDMNGTVTLSADADELARQISRECYLYYSPGVNFTMEGFRAARDALACAPTTSRRKAYSNKAVLQLKKAAEFWLSPQLVSGRLLRIEESESYEQMANRALEADSPLAKSADILMQLGEFVSVVHICKITASNFTQDQTKELAAFDGENSLPSGVLPWERSLYHKSRLQSENDPGGSNSSSTETALVVQTNVSAKDAISTCHAIVLYHLGRLLNSSNLGAAFSMVSACAYSKDKEFLNALFEFMLKSNHQDTLLRITSEDLEKWLRDLSDHELLRRYYTIQEQHSHAGKLMWEKATATSEETTTLDERLDYLSKAVSSFKASKETNEKGVNPAEIEKLLLVANDTFDLARLQHQALGTIIGLGLQEQLEEEQMKKLKMSLVDVSDLYNEFTAPLGLFEVCLRIMHCCKHNDEENIQMLWKSIIMKSILPVATRQEGAHNLLQKLLPDGLRDRGENVLLLSENEAATTALFEQGNWLETLKLKVTSLGKDLYGNGFDYACPINLLVGILEGTSLSIVKADCLFQLT